MADEDCGVCMFPDLRDNSNDLSVESKAGIKLGI